MAPQLMEYLIPVLVLIAFLAGQWFGYRYGAMAGRAEGYTARRLEELGKR